jgi:hypothetical protein
MTLHVPSPGDTTFGLVLTQDHGVRLQRDLRIDGRRHFSIADIKYFGPNGDPGILNSY